MNWNTVQKAGIIVLLVLVVVGVLCIFLPKYRTFCAMRNQAMDNKAENREISAKTKDLVAKQDDFLKSPAVVERTAREEGRIKPDELLFKPTNRTSQARSP